MRSYFAIFIVLIMSIPLANQGNAMVFAQETISLNAQFLQQENEYLEGDNDFQSTQSNFTTNDKNLCPSDSCIYSLNLQLHPDIVGTQYAIDGTLDINNTNGNEKQDQQYDIRVEIITNGTLDENQTLNNIVGEVGIGGNVIFNPLYQYTVVNGTLVHIDNNASIILNAVKE